jgi:replicative DNA helicase
MYDGTIKLVQNVEVGDVLMGDDSTPRNVLTLARGREKMYRINASDDEEYTVNESHILSLKVARDYGKIYKEGDVHDIAVKDYLQLSKTARSILLGYRAQIEYAERPIQADPYVMGHIMNLNYNLHNEHSGETSVVTIFRDVYNYIHKVTNLGTTDEEYIVHVLHYWKDPYFKQKMADFRKYSHIQMEYKCNTREVRMRTLAGILDTSVATNRHVDYYITEVYDNGTLANDIVGLARSLGFGAEIIVTYKGHDRNKSLVRIYGDNIGDIPVERNYFRIKPGTCMKRKSANVYSMKLTELWVRNRWESPVCLGRPYGNTQHCNGTENRVAPEKEDTHPGA